MTVNEKWVDYLQNLKLFSSVDLLCNKKGIFTRNWEKEKSDKFLVIQVCETSVLNTS